MILPSFHSQRAQGLKLSFDKSRSIPTIRMEDSSQAISKSYHLARSYFHTALHGGMIFQQRTKRTFHRFPLNSFPPLFFQRGARGTFRHRAGRGRRYAAPETRSSPTCSPPPPPFPRNRSITDGTNFNLACLKSDPAPAPAPAPVGRGRAVSDRNELFGLKIVPPISNV